MKEINVVIFTIIAYIVFIVLSEIHDFLANPLGYYHSRRLYYKMSHKLFDHVLKNEKGDVKEIYLKNSYFKELKEGEKYLLYVFTDKMTTLYKEYPNGDRTLIASNHRKYMKKVAEELVIYKRILHDNFNMSRHESG